MVHETETSACKCLKDQGRNLYAFVLDLNTPYWRAMAEEAITWDSIGLGSLSNICADPVKISGMKFIRETLYIDSVLLLHQIPESDYEKYI